MNFTCHCEAAHSGGRGNLLNNPSPSHGRGEGEGEGTPNFLPAFDFFLLIL